MARAHMILVALMGLVPATALAHGPGGHPADPELHVNPALEECSIHLSPELTQSSYRRFVREFGSVSAFKLQAPPTMLGRGHFAVAIEYISFPIEDRSAAWNHTFAHPDAYHELGANQAFPKVRVRAGVTDDVEVGAFWTRNPKANYGWVGVEARYGVFRQSPTMPMSVAVRGAWTRTLYAADLDMHAATLDVAAGRTLWNAVTPYVSVGADAVRGRETSDAVNLETEEMVVAHATGGVEVRFGHVAVGAEGQVGALNSFQVQVAALF